MLQIRHTSLHGLKSSNSVNDAVWMGNHQWIRLGTDFSLVSLTSLTMSSLRTRYVYRKENEGSRERKNKGRHDLPVFTVRWTLYGGMKKGKEGMETGYIRTSLFPLRSWLRLMIFSLFLFAPRASTTCFSASLDEEAPNRKKPLFLRKTPKNAASLWFHRHW